MSKVVTYYNSMINFTCSVGHYLANKALYDDLMLARPSSPKSYHVLVDKHGGSVDVLRDKVNENWREILDVWNVLRKFAELLKVYDPNNDEDVDNAKAFVIMLQRHQKASDFRDKVRRWSRTELRKISETGKDPEKVYGFADFIDRYEKLELQRNKKKEKMRAMLRMPADPSVNELEQDVRS